MSDKDQSQTQSTEITQPVQQEPVREFIEVDTSNNSRLNKGEESAPLTTKETK